MDNPLWRLCGAVGTPSPHSKNAETGTVLAAHGVEVARVRRLYPHALRYPPARILATITALKDAKVDHVKALHRAPRLLGMDPQSWEARFAVFRELNLNPVKAISTCPSLLCQPSATLRFHLDALSHLGLDAVQVVRLCPSVLNYSGDRIRGTLDYLHGLGLDSVRFVNRRPGVLCFRVDTKLKPIVHFVTVEMGRDIAELQHNPACLSLSLDRRLRPRYAFAALHSKQMLGLSTLFFTSDLRFAKSIGRPLAEYEDWLSKRPDLL
jgi:hypothetical protein